MAGGWWLVMANSLLAVGGGKRHVDGGQGKTKIDAANEQISWIDLVPTKYSVNNMHPCDERTENLPILQDSVPYWGRCSKKMTVNGSSQRRSIIVTDQHGKKMLFYLIIKL